MLLSEIRKANINEYRQKRLQEPVMRQDKVVAGRRINFPTVNRELAFLRFLLNLAADEEILETVLAMKLPSEASRRKTRTIEADDYAEILAPYATPATAVLYRAV